MKACQRTAVTSLEHLRYLRETYACLSKARGESLASPNNPNNPKISALTYALGDVALRIGISQMDDLGEKLWSLTLARAHFLSIGAEDDAKKSTLHLCTGLMTLLKSNPKVYLKSVDLTDLVFQVFDGIRDEEPLLTKSYNDLASLYEAVGDFENQAHTFNLLGQLYQSTGDFDRFWNTCQREAKALHRAGKPYHHVMKKLSSEREENLKRGEDAVPSGGTFEVGFESFVTNNLALQEMRWALFCTIPRTIARDHERDHSTYPGALSQSVTSAFSSCMDIVGCLEEIISIFESMPSLGTLNMDKYTFKPSDMDLIKETLQDALKAAEHYQQILRDLTSQAIGEA